MKINANRAFIISDTHFGARSNSVEWITEMTDWFRSDFIPKVKENYRDGDILIHCGDVFDNRQSINLLVLHEGISLFEELSHIFVDGIYVIAGNHDVMKKTTNEVSSLDVLKYIPNVHVIKEPIIVEVNDAKCLFMPWRTNDTEERSCLKEYKIHTLDYLFCHTNIRSLDFNSYTEIDEGISISELKRFKQVYSGHIHWQQKRKNVTMIGNPYQMTRSDVGNSKGWYLLDFKTGKDQFFVNSYSSKFIKIFLNEYLEKTLSQLITECKNNRVDLYVPSNYLVKYQINSLIEELSKVTKRLDVIPFENDMPTEMIDGDLQTGFNIFGLCEKYVQNMSSLDDVSKNRVMSKITSIYHKILKDEK